MQGGECWIRVSCNLCVSCFVLRTPLWSMNKQQSYGLSGNKAHQNRCWNRQENKPYCPSSWALARLTALSFCSLTWTRHFRASGVGLMACFDFPIHQEAHCVWAVMSSLCGLDGRPWATGGGGTCHSQDPELWLVHVGSKVKDYRNMEAFLGV